ncbi:MAG: hypothetical protein GY870_07640, partial [archaeon]|nr:hypothetical protein [archaeon]
DESITDWGFEIDKYETCTLNGSSRIITNEIQINDILTEVIQKNEDNGWGFQLDEYFDNLPCKEIYTLFDSSFSGGFITDLNQSNRVIITGTEYNGTRIEDAENQNGVFTHQFLRAFERTDLGTENIYNNADIDKNGLTWDELFNYLCLNTLIDPQYCNQISENSIIRPKPSIISSTPFGSNHFEMELLIEGTNYIKEFTYDLLLDNNSVISEVSNLNLNFGTYIISYNDSLGPNIIGYIVSVTYANNMTLVLMNSSDLLDTDFDRVPDSIENVIGTSISNNDTDNDDLDDNIEISVYGTEPLNNDTDNDQLIDGEEILIYGTSTFLSDCDDDGLSDYEECIKYSTNPYENDTDQDGFDDLFEVLYFTDPLDYNSNWKIILNYIVITAVIIGVAIMVALSLVRYVNKPTNYASSSISIKNKSPNYSKKVKLKQNSKYISPNVRQLAKIIPQKLNSPEGKIGFDYFEKAVYKERTGKEHEALNYYIKALKSGVPEPYNTQIRKKYDIPLIQKKTKLYKTNLIEFEDELESECHYCEICHGIMKKEGRFLICSSCGEKFLL